MTACLSDDEFSNQIAQDSLSQCLYLDLADQTFKTRHKLKFAFEFTAKEQHNLNDFFQSCAIAIDHIASTIY